MDLNITPALVTELHEYAQRTRRPDQTALVLGADGWETRVWVDHADQPDPGVIAMTAEGVALWCDGEDLDDDAATALCEPSEPDAPSTYKIPDEHGDYDSTPSPDAEPVVVTGWIGDDGEGESWGSAWWFDQARATLLIGEQGRLGDQAAVTSLWCTPSGRLVQQTRQVTGDGRDHWLEVGDDVAVELTYTADPDVVQDDLPPLVEAAVLARRLVDVLMPPVAPPGLDHAAYGRWAERNLAEATYMVDAARVVADLLRQRVLADVRRNRIRAAKVVVVAHGDERGATAAAAKHLGMSPQTLNKLIGAPDA